MNGIQIYLDLHFKAHNSDLQIQIHMFDTERQNIDRLDSTKYFFLEVFSNSKFLKQIFNFKVNYSEPILYVTSSSWF